MAHRPSSLNVRGPWLLFGPRFSIKSVDNIDILVGGSGGLGGGDSGFRHFSGGCASWPGHWAVKRRGSLVSRRQYANDKCRLGRASRGRCHSPMARPCKSVIAALLPVEPAQNSPGCPLPRADPGVDSCPSCSRDANPYRRRAPRERDNQQRPRRVCTLCGYTRRSRAAARPARRTNAVGCPARQCAGPALRRSAGRHDCRA